MGEEATLTAPYTATYPCYPHRPSHNAGHLGTVRIDLEGKVLKKVFGIYGACRYLPLNTQPVRIMLIFCHNFDLEHVEKFT